jgi:hypothetical protein
VTILLDGQVAGHTSAAGGRTVSKSVESGGKDIAKLVLVLR